MTPIIPPGKYLYGLKHHDGRYEHAVGADMAEAAASIGWTMAEVKRAMPLKSGDTQAAQRASLEKFLKGKAQETPPTEQTEAGAQYVAPDMIGRRIPAGGLRSKTRQTAAPLELEAHAIEAKQGNLF